ncbi:agmatine deiminase family protein [Actinomadura nitritigenes]|uniref:agmatine deiminase family protein n=1 Tax=Actinomadura nitritigenes TaxID=134602 RepID=UPI003D91F5B6
MGADASASPWRITAPGRAVVHTRPDPGHPDHQVSQEVTDILRAATDARGERIEVVELLAPTVAEADGELLDYSYVDRYVTNRAILLGAFDDPRDAEAAAVLQHAYPDREIVQVGTRDIFRVRRRHPPHHPAAAPPGASMELITARPTGSPARAAAPHRGVLTVGLVQTRWHDDPAEHTATLSKGIAAAASAGAEVVFLPELTLSRPGTPPPRPRTSKPAHPGVRGEGGRAARRVRARLPLRTPQHACTVEADMPRRPAIWTGPSR